MGWQDLLSESAEQTFPWIGGRQLFWNNRTYQIEGPLPPEHGWYRFSTDGSRKIRLADPARVSPEWEGVSARCCSGYLVGNRLIPDQIQSTLESLLDQQVLTVSLVEPGLDRFTRATVACLPTGNLFKQLEFPLGPEGDVQAAYLEAAPINQIPNVTPALETAYRFCTRERQRQEERRQRVEQQRLEQERARLREEQLAEARKTVGSSVGRRSLAQHDIESAVRAALLLSRCDLLDVRTGYVHNEVVVRYRVDGRRLECVVDRESLRVLDAGICLHDSETDADGTADLSLESLPSVVREAVATGQLVVYRHA